MYYTVCKVNFTLMLREVSITENKITQLRKAKGMTQNELADAANVSRQTIISLEQGRYNPSITLAYKIAKIFDKSIEEVFIFNEE